MKNKLYLALLLISLQSLSSFAQDLKKGYFIDKANNRKEVLFKETDFTDLSSIKFKVTEDGNFQDLPVKDVVEFGMGSDYKFIKANVKHDKSFNTISESPEPVFENVDLFLNVLVEGDASLFSYVDKGKEKFFFKPRQNAAISQLIYRKYLTGPQTLREDTAFRNQLYCDLKCENLQMEEFLSLKYEKSRLVQVFEKYNSCKNATQTIFDNKTGKRAKINFLVFAGANYSSFKIASDIGYVTEAESKITPSFGGEVSLTMPSQKLEFFLRVGYERFSGETYTDVGNTFTTSVRREAFTLESNFINTNIGARYNFLLSNGRKIFIDASIGINVPFDDVEYRVYYPNSPGSDETRGFLKTNGNAFFNVGAGYMLTSKIGAEARFDTSRNIITTVTNSSESKFPRLSLNLLYKLK